MKDKNNSSWEMEDIAHQYKIENPNWTWKECWNKAKIIYRELNKLNKELWDNNKVYFKHNIPFSDFNDRDDEFGNKFFEYGSSK